MQIATEMWVPLQCCVTQPWFLCRLINLHEDAKLKIIFFYNNIERKTRRKFKNDSTTEPMPTRWPWQMANGSLVSAFIVSLFLSFRWTVVATFQFLFSFFFIFFSSSTTEMNWDKMNAILRMVYGSHCLPTANTEPHILSLCVVAFAFTVPVFVKRSVFMFMLHVSIRSSILFYSIPVKSNRYRRTQTARRWISNK